MGTQLDQKIGELKQQLQNAEDTDPLYLGNELQYLRHQIFFVHARIEISIDLLIGRGVIRYIAHKMTLLERRATYRQMQKLFRELGFIQKLRVAKRLYQFRDYPKIPNLIEKVNRLRNQFSHIAYNQDEVNQLTDKQNQIDVLETLVAALDGMNKIFSKFDNHKKQ